MDKERKTLPEDDDLVPFAEIVKQSGMTAVEVRLALGEAGELVRIFPGRDPFDGRVKRLVKRYPLKYTLALLATREKTREVTYDKDDQLVSFGQLVKKLGWAQNTVRKMMLSVSRMVRTFPDPKGNGRKLYPLTYTVRLLRREHGRVEARRLRAKEAGAVYWVSLAKLKLAIRQLRKLSRGVAEASRELETALEGLNRTPPLAVEIYTLPDPDLELVYPLTILVAPLRLVYWRATVPEIPIRGEAKTPHDAVLDLREKLAERFRQLQEEPELSSEPDLWQILNEFIQVRKPEKV